MLQRAIRWALVCAALGAVALGFQSSQRQVDDDTIEVEAIGTEPDEDLVAGQNSEAVGSGRGENAIRGSGQGRQSSSRSSGPIVDPNQESGPATSMAGSVSDKELETNAAGSVDGTASTKDTTLVKLPTASPPSSSPTTSAAQPKPETNGLTMGYDATKPSANWSKPAVGQTYADPIYRTKLRRATSAAGTRFNRNDYSRRQAENANGSYFMTYHGESHFKVYSVSSLELVRSTTIPSRGEPQWHPTNPNIIRHVAGGNASIGKLKLFEFNVETGETSVVADLTSRLRAELPDALYLQDRSEGSPSRDGSRYAWLVYDRNEEQIGLVSYDLANDKILGITTDIGSGLVDWASFSVNGNYVVGGAADGTYVYNADLTNRRVLTNSTEHSDLALDRAGNDVYVLIDYHDGSDTAGWLVSIDMRTLQRTKIFEVYDNDAVASMHISGRGFDKPGWVIVSTYNCKDAGAWTCGKVMAVELATNGRIVNLAHTYNCGEDYWTETHASVNRSFTRVYFNSDGGSCGIDGEVYQLEVPSFN